MIAFADASRVAALGLAVAFAAVSATAEEPHPPAEAAAQADPRPSGKPVCLNAAETRETVKSRHFLEPFAALRNAAAQRKAEALSARLCHVGDEFLYEITLLHHDGRLVHIEMDAGTGKLIPRAPREPAPKN
jgi:hypothetical protein